ncbi:MAG: hypothetical protein U1E53_12365 [Dongiaceae bacterium]
MRETWVDAPWALDPASRRRLGRIALKLTVRAAGAALPVSVGAALPAAFLALFARLCGLGSLIALCLALIGRRPMNGSLGLCNEAAAFGLLGSLAHIGLGWLVQAWPPTALAKPTAPR